MKVAILNNDFRAYWKNRLAYLRHYLKANSIDFYAVELFGKGSPYTFDVFDNNGSWRSCLFPDKSSDEISNKDIQTRLFSALDTINPDIIIGPSIVFYPGALGLRWAKKNKKKFVMFDDAMAGQVKRMFIVQWVKDLIMKQADGFWLPSPGYYDGYAYLAKRGMLFFYGFNSIDNARFKRDVSNLMNQKTIICVARLVPVKNIGTLIKAWSHVTAAGTNYKLVVVGDGPKHDELKALQLALNLKNVEFLGAIANEDIAECYHKADAFILPSFSETWGLVVNEAMAAGLPVLLSANINAGKYLLTEGFNGFRFDPRSVKDIAGAILKFINLDAASKMQMSANSLKIIDTVSYEKMGAQLKEALVKIKTQKTNKTGWLASVLINMWDGTYNTTGWDK